MHQAKVPLVSAYQIILSSRVHYPFNFELIYTDLISIPKLISFLQNELLFVALPFSLG